MSLQRVTLVLNASYEAINVISARRALTMVCNCKAEITEPSKHVVRTARQSFRLPSVIRLIEYRRIPHQNRSVTRKSILLRDRFTCQYCGVVSVQAGLTLDHVMPRSRNGPNTWENLVTCCYKCNNRKGSLTPAEAGMQLLHKPARIGIHAKHRLLIGPDDHSWDRYLFC